MHDEEKRKSHLPDLISNCLRVQLLYKDSVNKLPDLYPDIHSLRVIEMIQDKLKNGTGVTERSWGIINLLMCAGGDTRVIQ